MTPAGGCPEESNWCPVGKGPEGSLCVTSRGLKRSRHFECPHIPCRAVSHSEETVDKERADFLPVEVAASVSSWPSLNLSKKNVSSPNPQAEVVNK